MFEENLLILSAFRSCSLQQCDPQKAWSGLLLKLAYHVVPDSPLMYVIQSRRFNFFSPMRLPYNPVIDFSPPPVVMIATTGTCWAEEDGSFTLTAFNIAPHTAVGSGHHSHPRSLSRRKDSNTKQQLLLPLISLWINMGPEINPNLDSCTSLGQIQAQMNKKKPSLEATMYFLCISHSSTLPISHTDYFCMKICMPVPWRNTLISQPLLLSYPQQCSYSSVSWSYFKINYIHFKEFQNHKKWKM